MTRDDRRPVRVRLVRAQTEPIAAIVAVMALVAGIGMYAVYMDSVRFGQADRTTEEAAIEFIWADLEDGDRGVFPASEYATDMDGAMAAAIDRESLPPGQNVYIMLRAYDDAEPTVFAEAHFDSDGDSLTDQQVASTEPDFGPPRGVGEPDDIGVATRSVPIEVTPGDVRGGTLHVEVW